MAIPPIKGKPFADIRDWVWERKKTIIPNPLKPWKTKTIDEKELDANKLQKTLIGFKNKINSIIKEMVNLSRFEDGVEIRFTQFKNEIDSLKSEIDSLKSEIATHSTAPMIESGHSSNTPAGTSQGIGPWSMGRRKGGRAKPTKRMSRGGGVYTDKSNIHGEGVFTSKSYDSGDVIGASHTNNNGQWSTIDPLGTHYNHSDNPNCRVETKGNKNYVVANRQLRQGEEITVDYTKQPYLEQPQSNWMQKGGRIKLKHTKQQLKSMSTEQLRQIKKNLK